MPCAVSTRYSQIPSRPNSKQHSTLTGPPPSLVATRERKSSISVNRAAVSPPFEPVQSRLFDVRQPNSNDPGRVAESDSNTNGILGATSIVFRAPQWNSVVGMWIRGILERRPVRLVTVALADKMACIEWALMTRNEVYWAK